MSLLAIGGWELVIAALWLAAVVCESISYSKNRSGLGLVRLLAVVLVPVVGTILGLITGVRLLLAPRHRGTLNS